MRKVSLISMLLAGALLAGGNALADGRHDYRHEGHYGRHGPELVYHQSYRHYAPRPHYPARVVVRPGYGWGYPAYGPVYSYPYRPIHRHYYGCGHYPRYGYGYGAGFALSYDGFSIGWSGY